MPGDDDDAVFLAGKLGDDVVNRKISHWCCRGETVDFDVIAFQLRQDVLLRPGVPRASWLAGAEAVLAGPGSFALAVWISEFGLVQATHVSKPRKQQFKSRRVVISS